MYKVGVIGDHNSVLGFKAIGLDVFPCLTADEAKKTLHHIAKKEFAIVFITENLAKDIMPEIDRYKHQKLPAVVPISGIDGNYDIGFGNLKKSVAHAIGADILFGGVQQ